MFHDIPQAVLDRMAHLEAADARDRESGAPKAQRLRQVPPETGRFLAMLAAAAPSGAILEIGASGGYSGLWLALACRERSDRMTTIDNDENKVRLARETFLLAGMMEHVEVVQGDAEELLDHYFNIAFCFLDVEKGLYPTCYERVIPRLVPGGIFVADNLISHLDELKTFYETVLADARVDALLVPIGKGLLVCRKPAPA